MNKNIMMDGCQQDALKIMELFDQAVKIASKKGWSENTTGNRILGDQDFIPRMRSGRVTARKMLAARDKIKVFIKQHSPRK